MSQCNDCLFFMNYNEFELAPYTFGECHRYPPEQTQIGKKVRQGHACVKFDNWCGEFKCKIQKCDIKGCEKDLFFICKDTKKNLCSKHYLEFEKNEINSSRILCGIKGCNNEYYSLSDGNLMCKYHFYRRNP